MLRLAGDLLGGLWLILQLFLQRLQAHLEVGAGAGQFRFTLPGDLLVDARFLIHLTGEAGLLRLFPCQQFCQLVVALQLLTTIAQLGTQLLDLRLQLAQRSTGVGRGDERARFEAVAGAAERLVIPDGERPGDLQPIQSFAMLSAEFVSGLVALDA